MLTNLQLLKEYFQIYRDDISYTLKSENREMTYYEVTIKKPNENGELVIFFQNELDSGVYLFKSFEMALSFSHEMKSAYPEIRRGIKRIVEQPDFSKKEFIVVDEFAM